ncbi:MAG: methylenetetrahydrofolate reductase [Clostridiales bacterium]|jgi:methylenetetrahydrofolate reductase (NADPH)|nr:methylenetetrahydrofolate reductase [Clostridiales bacterium]
MSGLQEALLSGAFSVSAELGPPMSADAEFVRKKARALKGLCNAVNITDNQTAIVRMSSIAASCLTLSEGVEPIMQMTCRDRNRIAMQSDLLGAYALGIRNVLCLSGDHQVFGSHPESKNVYDIDSIQLVRALSDMKKKKCFINGKPMKFPPEFFIGAAANPFADPYELQMIRLHKKIEAGAEFIQTQAIYDLEKFEKWMEDVRAAGLHTKAYFLAGILVNKSVKSIEMSAQVPGIEIPQELMNRMRSAQSAEEEGKRIALSLIERISKIQGVSGIHIMAVGWESAVPEIIERSTLKSKS